MRETWQPVLGVFGEYYEASSLGRIRRIKPGHGTWVGRILKQSFNKHTGCLGVFLSAGKGVLKGFDVHILVAGAFLGANPGGMQVNHKDRNRANNELKNLEYTTPSGNIQHALQNGAKFGSRGERHYRAKLTWKQVKRMREYWETGNYEIKELARISGVAKNTMSYVVHHRTWKEANL